MVWQEVIKDSHVWVYEYIANGFRANAIAILLARDELAIVSPSIGKRTDANAFDPATGLAFSSNGDGNSIQ